jgi:serine phosphatase RsbU (regulator of sigma subunit)
MTSTSGPRIGFAEQAPSGREVGAAIVAAAGLYAIGGALCGTAALLPHVRAPGAIVAVAVNAFVVAAILFVAFRRQRSTLALAFAADLWGVVLIATLCAASNGASSPFALIYFFAIGHAAAFQPRGRYLIVTLACLVAFLLPLAYEHVSGTFGAVACVGIVLAVLTTGVIHLALNGVREHRRRLKFLIDATASFDTTLDPSEALRNLAQAAVPELAELCVIYLLDRDGSIESTVAAGVDAALAREVERVREEVPLDLAGPHPVAQVLRTGEPRVVADLTDQAALAQVVESDEHQQLMRDAGYRSAAVFPMVARGRTHGAIAFLHIGNDERYERGVLDVLADLSDRAALAFDNARLYAERSYVAHTLRRSLMPSVLPLIPGLELASFFRPMGAGSEVGGDFYDAFGDEQGCWLMVGDVCGKGAEAAALTGFLRHTTVAYAREQTSPAAVLSQVNRVMLDQDFEGRFATAILVHLRFAGSQAEVTVASAGHPAALIVRAGGAACEFSDRGALLGIFEDPVIEEASIVLQPGDSLALYTDGLLEAHAPDHTVTAQQMIERLQQHALAVAEDTIGALLGLVELDDRVRDDIAILTARVTGMADRVTRPRQHADVVPSSAPQDGAQQGALHRELGGLGRAEVR